MGVNFSEHCVALPDLEQRRLRGYQSDAWMASVRAADVEILRKEAERLEAEGYVSMLPYFSGCKGFSEKMSSWGGDGSVLVLVAWRGIQISTTLLRWCWKPFPAR